MKAQDASRHAGLRVQNGVLITQERHWGEAVMWLQAGTVPLTMGRGWQGLAGRFQVWREHIQVGEEFRAWGRLSALPQPCSLETMLETTAGPHRCNQGPPPRSQWWAFPTSRGGGGLPAVPPSCLWLRSGRPADRLESAVTDAGAEPVGGVS